MKMSAVAPRYLEKDPNDIKVHEEVRIRETAPNIEQQIEAMMISFQTSGQPNPIIIDEKNFLIAGYIRLIAARRLNMKIKVIKIYGLSSFQKLHIEMEENVRRKNFTSYELTVGLAQLKRKYEIEHPETKWGRNQYESGVAGDAIPKTELSLTFVKKHAKLFNLSERAMRERVRVGEIILNKKIDKKTIKLFKEDKITYTEIQEKLRAINRLKNEKEKLLSEKQKPDPKSDQQKKPKLEENEINENENPLEPNKHELDPKPDISNGLKDSGSQEKRMEETLPVSPPLPTPLPQNDAETKYPPGFPTTQTLDDETKTIIEIPATCKDCPAGRAIASMHCGATMIRCTLDEKERKFGIYMGNHPVCWRYDELASKENR